MTPKADAPGRATGVVLLRCPNDACCVRVVLEGRVAPRVGCARHGVDLVPVGEAREDGSRRCEFGT